MIIFFLCLVYDSHGYFTNTATPTKAVIYTGNEPARQDKAVGPLSDGEILDLRLEY